MRMKRNDLNILNIHNTMSDNKLVKSILDAATITGLVAGIGWVGKNTIKENFTADPSANIMNYVKFTAVMEQDRERNKAIHDFQDTDRALTLYNQTHRAKVALPQEPKFSDFYKASPQQKNGELLFIGGSMLGIGYAAFRFL